MPESQNHRFQEPLLYPLTFPLGPNPADGDSVDPVELPFITAKLHHRKMGLWLNLHNQQSPYTKIQTLQFHYIKNLKFQLNPQHV